MESQLSVQQTSTSSMIITPAQLYQHDFLLRLLRDRWRIQSRWILLIAVVLPTVDYLCWWLWTYIVPVPKDYRWTSANTLSSLVQIVVIFPLLFLLYLHLPTWLAGLFNRLFEEDIIGPCRSSRWSPGSYPRFVQLVTIWMDRWWWAAGAIGLNILYLCYRIAFVELPKSTPIPLWLLCLGFAFYLPVIYATFLCIIRILIAFLALNWLFLTFTIQIKPLHPDGSGGLGALGRIIWVSAVLLLWDALLLYTGLISRNLSVFTSFEISLLGVIYVALIPCIFIGWLLLPHLVMLQARKAALTPLAQELAQAMTQMTTSSSETPETLRASTDRFVELKRRYDCVYDAFPTWPVSLQTLGRLLVLLVLPALLAALVPLALNWISHLWSLWI